jgi:hypothetical protein
MVGIDASESECEDCGESFSARRRKLGYRTCLTCGDRQAQINISKLMKQSGPAYNKGPYMLITNRDAAKDLGR